MDKKQGFQYKLEFAKRKKDFLKNLAELKKAQKDISSKKEEINELLKQEKISYKNNIKNAVFNYKNEIKKQKNEIGKQQELIQKEQIKFREISKLELQKLDKENLNKKYKFEKNLLNIKMQTKKVILENKKLIKKMKQENKNKIIEQALEYDHKKIELAKAQTVHLEKLAKHKGELENIKRQQAYDKVDLYKKLNQLKTEKSLARKRKEHELKTLIQKEIQSFELDTAKMQYEQISYDNLMEIRKQENKIKNEKLKLKTEEMKQDQKLKELIQKQVVEKQKESLKNKQAFPVEDHISSPIVDKKAFPLQINLNDNIIKGFVISDVGKRAIKVFNKLNVVDTSNKLNKAKISHTEKLLIEKIKELKIQNALIPINDYVQLALFMSDKNLSKEKIQALIVSVVYNIYNGKIFSFLGGYFSLVKIKGYKRIIYSKTKSKMSRFSVISLPNSDVTKILEKILVKKLSYNAFIKITENIVLTNLNNKIKIITDMGFMR